MMCCSHFQMGEKLARIFGNKIQNSIEFGDLYKEVLKRQKKWDLF